MKILVIEDDLRLGEQIIATLEANSWLAELSVDGEDGLYRASSEAWDVVILDLGLPKLDGLSVLKKLRAQGINTPIIILSARGSLSERVEGLNSGADDYIVKPFDTLEVITRIKVQLRQASGNKSPVVVMGDLSLDTVSSQVCWKGERLSLTALEYKIIAYFMYHPKKVISKTELIEHIYKQDFDRDSNTLEVFVGRIRKKTTASLIKTVRGLGYQLNGY